MVGATALREEVNAAMEAGVGVFDFLFPEVDQGGAVSAAEGGATGLGDGGDDD